MSEKNHFAYTAEDQLLAIAANNELTLAETKIHYLPFRESGSYTLTAHQQEANRRARQAFSDLVTTTFIHAYELGTHQTFSTTKEGEQ